MVRDIRWRVRRAVFAGHLKRTVLDPRVQSGPPKISESRDVAGFSTVFEVAFMTQSTTARAERAHKAAKRYIYAFGGGHAEGDATE